MKIPRRLTLAEAAQFVAERRKIELDEARTALLSQLRGGEIAASGAVPLNALADIDRAWRLAVATKQEDIPASAWALAVDWAGSRVGRYREIAIPEPKLTAMFQTARGPRKRPPLSAVKVVVEAYVALEKKDQKPTSQDRCWEYVKEHLPEATREQSLKTLGSIESAKQRGRPRKRNSPKNPPKNSPP